MDSPEPVNDETVWRLAAAYISAWNRRDRDAWLDLLHPELDGRSIASACVIAQVRDGKLVETGGPPSSP